MGVRRCEPPAPAKLHGTVQSLHARFRNAKKKADRERPAYESFRRGCLKGNFYMQRSMIFRNCTLFANECRICT